MEIHPIAIGTITAAGIAGVISFLSLVISKEQKTSEFRQQWIDALRSDVSELLGHLDTAIQHARAINRDQGEDNTVYCLTSERFEKIKNEVNESERLYSSILLRINPVEHSEIVDSIEKMRIAFSAPSLPSPDELHGMEQTLIKVTQKVLKIEWNRVKKGEPIYRGAKFIALLLFIASLIAGFYSFGHSVEKI